MENTNIISIADRVSAEKDTKKGCLSSAVSLLILASDIIWFSVRRTYGRPVEWWEILILVISGLFLLFSLFGLMFTSYNNSFNKKIINEPLISYDSEKKVFLVYSFIDMKLKEFSRDDIKSVSINVETDEVTLKYKKNDKDKTLSIGYADFHLERSINDSILKYKNEVEKEVETKQN